VRPETKTRWNKRVRYQEHRKNVGRMLEEVRTNGLEDLQAMGSVEAD
jgi:hypothetical protein